MYGYKISIEISKSSSLCIWALTRWCFSQTMLVDERPIISRSIALPAMFALPPVQRLSGLSGCADWSLALGSRGGGRIKTGRYGIIGRTIAMFIAALCFTTWR